MSVGLILGGFFVLLFIFVIMWNLLYEGRNPNVPPTQSERRLARIWLNTRRFIGFTIGGIFLFMAIGMLVTSSDPYSQGTIGAAFFSLFISFMSCWFAVYGGGTRRSMIDDKHVHEERKKQYGWRW